MTIQRITLKTYYIRETRIRVQHQNSDGRMWSRYYPASPASLERIANLCNSDQVNVVHYVGKDGRIGLEIYKETKR